MDVASANVTFFAPSTGGVNAAWTIDVRDGLRFAFEHGGGFERSDMVRCRASCALGEVWLNDSLRASARGGTCPTTASSVAPCCAIRVCVGDRLLKESLRDSVGAGDGSEG